MHVVRREDEENEPVYSVLVYSTFTVLFDVHSRVYVVAVGFKAVEVPVVWLTVRAFGVWVRVVVRV